jgi:hypothetical protein
MIKGFFLLLIGFFALEQNTSAPPALAWKTLEGIGFDKRFVEDMNDYFLFPEFTKQIKALEGKTVDVEGYVIPFDKTGAEVALSANPYAACFFCGKAGPASIMIVKLKVKNTKLRTDMYKTFRGKLKLNATDPDEFYYILEDAIMMD